MKLSKLFILAALPLLSVSANAQDKNPQKGDFTVALTLGYNNTVMQKASSYTGSMQALSTNWNDKGLAVNIEGGWFFQNQWKLLLGGGMNITKNPGYEAIPGTGHEPGDVPSYGAIADQSFVQYTVFTGVDRYFKTKVDGLMPYVGVRGGFAYGRNSSFTDDENNMGKCVGEAFNVRGALTAGVDYFLTEGLFIGAEVNPFAYTYNRTLIKPQAGLKNYAANSHNFAFLAAPTLKIGFKF